MDFAHPRPPRFRLLAGASLTLVTLGGAHAQCVNPLQIFDYTGAIVSYPVPSTGDY